MPVKEIEKNPSLHNGTLTEARKQNNRQVQSLCLYRKLWMSDELADSEVVASILTDEGIKLPKA